VKLTTDPGIRKALQCVYPVQVSSAMTLPCVERGKLNLKICSIFYFDKDFVVGSRERQTVSNSQVVEEIMYAASLALTKGTRLFEVSEIRVDITHQQFEQCLHRGREPSRMSPNIQDKLKHLGAYIFPLIKIHQCCKYEPHPITGDAATRRPSNWKHPKWPPRAEDSKPNQRSL